MGSAPITELSFQQQDLLEEAFNLLKDSETQNIAPADLITLMRSLGINPTKEDMEDIFDERNPEADPDNMDLNEVESIIIAYLNNTDYIEEVLEIFRKYDKHKSGVLSGKECKDLLAQAYPYMSREELGELLRDCYYDDDSEIEYEEFIYSVVGHDFH